MKGNFFEKIEKYMAFFQIAEFDLLSGRQKTTQGGHKLWKTGKMVKKKSLQGKIREF